MHRSLLLAAVLCGTLAPALAQAPAAGAATGRPDMATPASSATSFRCGGVGKDASEAMKAQAGQHDLLLTFAAASGAYLADVDVEVRGSGGRVVLQAHCDGPLMLVELAADGRYEVTARAQGQTQRKSVTIGPKPARLAFTWVVS